MSEMGLGCVETPAAAVRVEMIPMLLRILQRNHFVHSLRGT
jgi:hypothetical protein